MSQIIELLKNINYQVSKELLFNYKKLNITDSEFIILIYLINQSSTIYNPKQIGNDLKLDLNNVLELINSLCEKNIIKIEMKKINNIRSEVISLDSLYEKIAFVLTEVEEKNDSNLYGIFETEFGRTLSPMEFEIINGWLDNGYTEELIKLALKEATYNGVSNLRYIDKIIYEWGKKGIKTKEDVENNRKQFKNNNANKNQELFDYDWLND
ncbi:MAG: DnaD domain protein [Bacilli bacterium]|nr:DnaD domain protein [Bacilli bacterium]